MIALCNLLPFTVGPLDLRTRFLRMIPQSDFLELGELFQCHGLFAMLLETKGVFVEW